jgi:hypothetical protein
VWTGQRAGSREENEARASALQLDQENYDRKKSVSGGWIELLRTGLGKSTKCETKNLAAGTKSRSRAKNTE